MTPIRSLVVIAAGGAGMPRPARIMSATLVVLLLVYTAALAFPVLPPAPDELFQKWASNALFLGSAVLCGWRAVADRHERTAWMLFSLGLLAWGLGDLYFTLALWDLDQAPVPSPADAGYLALYPLAVAGLVSLFRSRVSRRGRLLWVDGLIGALAVSALAATVLFDAVLASIGGTPASVATNMSYPLADMLLAAFVAGVLAMSGFRLDNAWGRIAAGLVLIGISDTVYLYQSAAGSYQEGTLLDACWPLAAFIIARAGWMPAPTALPATGQRWRAITFPLTFGLSCLAMLVWDHFTPVNLLALGLSAAAMVLVLVRLGLTFADNMRILAASHSEAHTDALTGLGNRRALMGALDTAVADANAGGCQRVLAMFDLDGFKGYNDSFGHPAGDALLARLGARLREDLGGAGIAYRVGGDEFCTLRELDGDHEHAVRRAAHALSASGEGFAVGCSYGSVIVPHDAATAEAALQVVDERMYVNKQNGRASAGRQSGNVLHQVLNERYPHLAAEGREVGELAAAVARQLGMSEADVQTVLLAGELHDLGKVAIPDAILGKPGPLTEAESEFIRRHSIIGERIVAAAPALSDVARIVRSSHERIDGAGYPDGLAGDEIPLAARVVFACDAFWAMTSERPYAPGITEEAALAELSRCAGTQFDQAVVDAFWAVVAAGEPGIAPVVS